MLIDHSVHHECMAGLIFIALIAAFFVLVYVAGADSRIDDVARRRRYNG